MSKSTLAKFGAGVVLASIFMSSPLATASPILPAVAVADGAPSAKTEAQSFSFSESTPEQTQRLIDAYVSGEGEAARFDLERAERDGATSDTMELGEFYSAMAQPAQNNEVSTYGVPPVYGRWCGPGASGPGKPIDTLDSLCKAHDICYDKKGYFNRSCDSALVSGIARNWSKMSKKQKIYATAIAAVFSKKLGLPNPVPGQH